jgi:hypothetical protein
MPRMETIKTALFEDPFSIYLILALAGAAIIVAWRAGGRSGRWLAARLLVVAVLAGGTFAIERLVVTDREQIQLALRDIASSVPAGRIDHAMSYLDEKYLGWGRFRPGVIAAVKAAVAKYQIREIRLIGKCRIEVADKLANCKVSVLITYNHEGTDSKYPMAWNVKWIKRPEGWRIQGAEPTTDFMP